LSAPENLPIS